MSQMCGSQTVRHYDGTVAYLRTDEVSSVRVRTASGSDELWDAADIQSIWNCHHGIGSNCACERTTAVDFQHGR